MQRLFSTFANGWPGKGLLVLRLSLASFAVHDCVTRLETRTGSLELAVAIVYGSAALLFLVGLWTPVAAGLIALFHGWSLVSHPASFREAFLAGAIAVAIALLGPGAYSVDARIYGRKRISIGSR